MAFVDTDRVYLVEIYGNGCAVDSACGKPHRYAENALWTVPRQEKQLDADDHGIADMHCFEKMWINRSTCGKIKVKCQKKYVFSMNIGKNSVKNHNGNGDSL